MNRPRMCGQYEPRVRAADAYRKLTEEVLDTVNNSVLP